MSPEEHRQYLDKLRQDIAALKAIITGLESQLAQKQEHLNTLHQAESLVGRLVGEQVEQPFQSSTEDIVHPADQTSEPPIRHADVIEKILREVGKPMKISQIIRFMHRKGCQLEGSPAGQYGTIYSAMRRRPKVFKRLRRGEWGLNSESRGKVQSHTPRRIQPASAAGSTSASPVSRLERIEEILRQSGRPLRVTEILEALVAKGDGKQHDRTNFYNIIDSSLRTGEKHGRFRKTGRATWDLVDRAEANGDDKVDVFPNLRKLINEDQK